MNAGTASMGLLHAPTARHTARSLLVALAVSAVILLGLTLFWRPVLQAVLPLQAAALQSFTNQFTVRSVTLQRQGLDEAVQAELVLVGPFKRADGRAVQLPPNASITTHVSAAKAMLPLAVLAMALALWPVSDKREYTVRAFMGTAAALALVVFDFPMVLLGLSWGALHDAIPGLPTSHSEGLARFMESGGRLCLALSAALGVVVCARWMVDGWPQEGV